MPYEFRHTSLENVWILLPFLWAKLLFFCQGVEQLSTTKSRKIYLSYQIRFSKKMKPCHTFHMERTILRLSLRESVCCWLRVSSLTKGNWIDALKKIPLKSCTCALYIDSHLHISFASYLQTISNRFPVFIIVRECIIEIIFERESRTCIYWSTINGRCSNLLS